VALVPRNPSLRAEAKEAWRDRELLFTLVKRELDVRYKNSLFGVAWSLANPLVRALVLWAVFDKIAPLGVNDYSAYLLAAFLPWTFFLTGTLDAAESVSKQMALVRKVYFPRELLPIATTMANLRHFLLSLVAVALPFLLFLYGRDSLATGSLSLPPAEILLVPLLVVLQTLLIAGLALFLSALNVFFEDTKFLAAVLLDLLFYAVPIIYFIEQVAVTPAFEPATARLIHDLFLLNPMTVLLVCWRVCLLRPTVMPAGRFGLADDLAVNQGIPWVFLAIAAVVCIGAFVGGYTFFNRRKWRFVEQL
jgi:ABC-type polysaccharide/polyol phosphate export permease